MCHACHGTLALASHITCCSTVYMHASDRQSVCLCTCVYVYSIQVYLSRYIDLLIYQSMYALGSLIGVGVVEDLALLCKIRCMVECPRRPRARHPKSGLQGGLLCVRRVGAGDDIDPDSEDFVPNSPDSRP